MLEVCPNCGSTAVQVDEGYDLNNPSAPTRCYEPDCNYTGIKKEFGNDS